MEIVCYASIIWCGLMIRRSVQKATFEHCGNFRAAERSREVTVSLTLQAVLPLAALLIGAFCILVCVSAYTVGTYLSFYFISYMTVHVPWKRDSWRTQGQRFTRYQFTTSYGNHSAENVGGQNLTQTL
ncbi:hypothetical protein AAVH_07551 [Aphelenchoides avenae]|nr:hypothetical protein AAVH_07551 [Aphelenchus avenae]